jgi:hypothetical protein
LFLSLFHMKVEGKVVPVHNCHEDMGERMYRSTYSWPWH